MFDERVFGKTAATQVGLFNKSTFCWELTNYANYNIKLVLKERKSINLCMNVLLFFQFFIFRSGLCLSTY